MQSPRIEMMLSVLLKCIMYHLTPYQNEAAESHPMGEMLYIPIEKARGKPPEKGHHRLKKSEEYGHPQHCPPLYPYHDYTTSNGNG